MKHFLEIKNITTRNLVRGLSSKDKSSLQNQDLNRIRLSCPENEILGVTDLILKANQLIQDPKKKVQIFGAENRLYVHHKLGELDFYSYWKGKFEKDYPLTYQDKDILKDTQYVVDMSIIKNDGGGSQYTFLEAIYQGCVLILHREWITSCSLFKEGVNCLAVETPEELASILSETRDITKILKESRKLLKSHLQVVW